MLKKIKNFLLGLTLVFSCLLTGKFISVENKTHAASVQTPTLEETTITDAWSYNDDVLTLNGVDWSGSLILENDLTIILNGENKIQADDYVIFSCYSLTFSGAGSLELMGSPVIYCDKINFGENQKVIIDSNPAVLGSEVTNISEASYVKIFTPSESIYGDSGDIGEGGTSSEPSTSEKQSVTISTPNDATTTTISAADLQLSNNLENNSYDLANIFTCTEGAGAKTYYYKKSGEADWTSIAKGSSMPVSEAGTYNVKVKVAENDKYQAAEKEHELVIAKADVKVKLTLGDWMYGYYSTKNPEVPTVSFHVGGQSVTLDYSFDYYSNNDYAAEHKLEGIPVNVGTYYPLVTVPETGLTNAATNLTNDEAGNAKVVTVSPREITNDIVWSGKDDNFIYTYNATARAVTAYWVKTDTPDGTDGEIIEFNVTISENTTKSSEFKNAGTYTATIVSFKTDQPNYTLPSAAAEGGRTKSYTINKVAFTINVDSKSKTFGDEPPYLNLTAQCVGGEIVDKDAQGQPVVLYEISMAETITKQTDIGKYPIVATLTNIPEQANYDITINNGYYYVKNKIHSLSISNWIYGGTASTPSASAYVKENKITYYYYEVSYGGLVESKLDSVPTEPGSYRLKAVIEDDEIYNQATALFYFEILKIQVAAPEEDKTVYTYDGTYKNYNIPNRDYYTIENQSQRDAGSYKVKVMLNNSEHYEWSGKSNVLFIEYSFVINKKQVQKPAETPVIYKYTGSPISYTLADNADYVVSSNNVQTEPGAYKITISLSDKKNTEWNDGTQTDLEREFVIYNSMITNPTTVDYNGKSLSVSPVVLVDASGNGVAPDLSLNVKVASTDDAETLNSVKEKLGDNIKKYDKIFVVYDVSLTDGSETKQPEGLVTLKMKVPSELNGAKFTLFHVHTDASGNQTVEAVEYDGVSDDGYIILQTNKLSEFVFVYEQDSLLPLIILFACLSAVLTALLVLQIIMLIKKKKKSSVALAAAVPVFFVKSEVTASVVLGVVFALLLAANIVLLVLLLGKRKSQTKKEVKAEDNELKAVDMAKVKEEKIEDVQETEEMENKEISPEEVVELKTKQENTTGTKKKSNKSHSKKN